MARTALLRKKEESLEIPADKRWTVVSEATGRRIYLPSQAGIDRSGAEALAEQLLCKTQVVPEAALRSGKLDASLLPGAIEAAEREDEE